MAFLVGKYLAEKAKGKGITKVVLIEGDISIMEELRPLQRGQEVGVLNFNVKRRCSLGKAW